MFLNIWRLNRIILLLFRIAIFLLGVAQLTAQELFPVNEPASTVPYKVIGVRLSTHLHYKYQTLGHREMVRVLYGVTPTITAMATLTTSNFHVAEFPDDLNEYYRISHNHKSGSDDYGFRFEGFHLLAKWRFITRDYAKEHFRVALLTEIAQSKSTHLDAYPNLVGDHGGIGTGIIATKLQNRLAASLTAGVTHFFSSVKKTGADIVEYRPGRSLNLNFSTGYRIFPNVYTSINNLNINLYLEANAKMFQGMSASRNGINLNTFQFDYLRNGNLCNVYPGIQLIFNSITRLDLSAELPVLTSNRTGRYSMLMISLQHFFF